MGGGQRRRGGRLRSPKATSPPLPSTSQGFALLSSIHLARSFCSFSTRVPTIEPRHRTLTCLVQSHPLHETVMAYSAAHPKLWGELANTTAHHKRWE